MSQGLIEVVEGGIGNSIQDAGRLGYRHMGITVSGALDSYLARCANALVGNTGDCAVIEIRAAGPHLRVVAGPLRVALAGSLGGRITRADGSSEAFTAWQSFTLAGQDELEFDFLSGGTACLALSGGVDSPLQLGSRATYQRALIGGLNGRPLSSGDLLPCALIAPEDRQQYSAAAWTYADEPVRVMLGPQAGHFEPDAVAQFLASAFRVTADIDRMGVRLEGTPLRHVSPAAADIVSDGVTPGTLQVPGNGQPIILLADCQTVGGYPKIATVISADLPRLGQLRPGQSLRFCAVDGAEARRARRAREAQWAAWAAGVRLELPDLTRYYNDMVGRVEIAALGDECYENVE
jgi:biotin-dependent carboxylase-like uncharacterized protein